MGHYKTECPQAKQLEQVQLAEDLDTPQTWDEMLMVSATRPPTIMPGKVNEKEVTTICLDPGTARTFIHERWIPNDQLTGEVVTVGTINPGNKCYDLALTTIEVAGLMFCSDEISLNSGKWA